VDSHTPVDVRARPIPFPRAVPGPAPKKGKIMDSVVSCGECGNEAPAQSDEIRYVADPDEAHWECTDYDACADRQLDAMHQPHPGEMDDLFSGEII